MIDTTYRTEDGSMMGTKICTSSDETRWRRRALWLIIALGCFRLLYAMIVPLDLVHDEAYYWDWSRQLDWGYYSKPPMVAWLIALSTSLGGSSAFAVRVPAILLGTAGLGWMYLLAARLYGRQAGFWAALIAAATPGNAAMSLLMTIDAPLLFCWGAALYMFWRMLERGPRQMLWLTGAVVSVGFGLLSKQTMLGFLALGGLFVLTSHDDRRELTRPNFWVWLLGALSFLAPVAWWNSQHGWVTIQHTSGHFAGDHVDWIKRLSRSGEFVAGQLGVISPVTCFLLVAVMCGAFLAFRRLGRKERFLLCFSGLPLAGVYVLSLMRRVEPNWPAPFYLSAMVLLVGAGLKRFPFSAWPLIRESHLVRAAAVGGMTVAVAYLIPFGWGLQGSKLDATVRLRGWQQLASAVAQRFATFPRPGKTFIMVTSGRAVASELAFYLPHQPRVYLWNYGDQIVSQYDLWGGPTEKADWDALIVTPKGGTAPPELAAQFARVEDCGEIAVPIGAGRSHTYRIWRGVRFGTLPETPYLAERVSTSTRLR